MPNKKPLKKKSQKQPKTFAAAFKAANAKAIAARGREQLAVKEPAVDKRPLNEQLISAAKMGRVDLINQLLKKKTVDVDFQDDENNMEYSYSHHSEYRGQNWKNIQPPDARRGSSGHTALMWACLLRHEKAAIALLRGGADPRIVNLIGETALHLSGGGSEELVHALVEAGADVNARNLWGATPLVMALEADSSGRLRVAWTLLGYGADPDIKTSSGDDAYAVAKELELDPIFISQMKQRAESFEKAGGPKREALPAAKAEASPPDVDPAEAAIDRIRIASKKTGTVLKPR